ncbi:MAG: hypothetical protein IKS69_03510 [Erysipelotrichaceae bacterium]|nr:hypothetical protein [Erysipelotrichaceae bacterium]
MFFNKLPAYLIDSENVGSTWIDLLKNDDRHEFYIFVTENAKSLNFSLLKELTDNQKHKINIIECEPGRNSLDFYLSSYLGYLIGGNRHSSYTVVSQDTGFDHVIDYWKNSGLDVCRINTKPDKASNVRTRRTARKETAPVVKKNENSETRIIVKKEQTPVKKEPVPAKKTENPSPRNRNKNVPEKKEGNDRKLLHDLLKDYPDKEIEEIGKVLDTVPVDKHANKSYIYRHLIRKFKSEKGLAIYTLIKKDLDRYYRHSA